MLNCGLRVGEMRRLRLTDLDFAGRRARIEQSKDLQDRVVYLSQAAPEAPHAYLEVRGPACPTPGRWEAGDHVFVYRQRMGLGGPADADDPANSGVLALVDALQGGTLNDAQRETVCALRASLLVLVEREMTADKVD